MAKKASTKKAKPDSKEKLQEEGLPKMTTVDFIKQKKKDMKNSVYRQRFDTLYYEIQANLVNTSPVMGGNSAAANGARWTFATTYQNGSVNVFPILRSDTEQNITKTPSAKEPVAFSKILIAAATLGAKVPDGTFESDNKVFARASHDLWKRTWENQFANGENTLGIAYQNNFTYGWTAWRTYPRQIIVPHKGSKKVKFDDIYREPMDPARTWLGRSVNNFDGFARGECYYEKDVPKADFLRENPKANGKNLYCFESDEAKDQKPNDNSYVTVQYYENELTNKYIVASGDYVMYDGELPNDDAFGYVEWGNCFIRDINDPYGVGLYELARGNAAMNDYISGMNAIQVEAEIYPLLFGANIGNGEMKYRRGPNIINPKMQGTTLDVVRTTGNVSQGIQFADLQKKIISESTGVNDILAGQAGEGTLGSTVILKEAALQRLTLPRNSVVRAIERDAYKTISWIMQTYSVAKVEIFDTEDEYKKFFEINPSVFMTQEKKKNRKGDTKYIGKYSPYVQVGFDFQGEKLMEAANPISIARSSVIQLLKEQGNISDILLIKIDPNSTLIPSQEINKQQTLELYSLVSAKTIELMTVAQTNPMIAKALLAQLIQILETYKVNVNKWIPKELVDSIEQAAMQGPAPTPGMPGEEGAEGAVRAPTPGEIPAPDNKLRKEMGMMAQSQGARPSNPVRDAVYGSIGRSASGPRSNFIK